MTRLSLSCSMLRARSRATSGLSEPRISANAARTRQSRSGSMPDSTNVKDSGSIAAAARKAAARMAGQSSVSRSCATASPSVALIAPSAVIASSRTFGCVAGCDASAARTLAVAGALICTERPDSTDHDLERRLGLCVEQPRQALCGRCLLQNAQPARRERRRVAARDLQELQQRRCRARILDALQCVRHGPPRADRAIGLQHRGGERLVRLEANQGEQRELEGFRLRCDWRCFVVRLHPGDGRGPRVLSGDLSDRRVPLRLRPPCPALPLRAPARAAPCQRGRASARLPPMRRRSGPVRTRPSRARPGRGRQASPKALRSRPGVRRGRWQGPRGAGSAVHCPSRERSDRAAVAEAAVEAGA